MKKFFHSFLYKKSIRFQLASAITATILLPVLIIGFASAFNVLKSNTSLATGTITQISANVLSEFNSLYTDIDDVLINIAAAEDVKKYFLSSGSEYELYRFYSELQNDAALNRLMERYPIIEGVTFVGSDGRAYTYSASSSSLVDYDTGSINAVRQLIAKYPDPSDILGTQVLVSEFPAKNSSKVNYISFLRYVRRNDDPIGYALINFDASMLKNLWHSVDTNNIEVQILHSDGTIIYHDNNVLINTDSDLIFREEFDEQSRGNFIAETNGIRQLIVYDSAKKSDCLILTSIPMSILRTPSNNVILIIMITCILAILFTLALGYLLVKSILQPALILRDYVSNFSEGKFEVTTEEFPQNEIGELADAYNSMAMKINDMIEQVYNAEIEKGKHALAVKQAELHAMQMQITPHFIYNTLSTISAHAILIDNTAIQDMVNSLSSLMRYTLGQVWIPTTLEEEIAQLQPYLKIQSYRRTVMPKVTIDIDGYEDCVIMRLLLQPIVENIFTHAFSEGIDSDSFIDIRAYSEDDTLFISVSDNGCGISAERLDWLKHHIEEDNDDDTSNGGIGVRNVHRRIQLIYGSEYGLRISNNADGGTTMTAVMPLKRQA